MKLVLLLVTAGIASASGQIVVDGDASEWTGTPPATVNSATYTSSSAGTLTKLNEWIWRDAVGDFRTDLSTTFPDLLEVRLASDGTNLYYLCKTKPPQSSPPPMMIMTLRREGSTSTQRIIPGFTDTMTPESAAWDFAIGTPSGSGGTANRVWASDFSLANTGSFSKNGTTGIMEGSVPWSALGGQPGGLEFLFTISLYCAQVDDNSVDVLGPTISNCLDCVTTNGGNTWAAVSTGTLDYAAPVQFLGDHEVLPIRIASFTATPAGTGMVRIEWTTLSELNSYGVYVERKCPRDSTFGVLPGGFIAGRGSSATPFHYAYSDAHPVPGEILYRLRQVDLDGMTHYSEQVRVNVTASGDGAVPAAFALLQNYPNPFNPATTIRYSLPSASFATMTVFNSLGQVVATPVRGTQEAGNHVVPFDAHGLSNGVYFYRLQAGEYTRTMKFLLLK